MVLDSHQSVGHIKQHSVATLGRLMNDEVWGSGFPTWNGKAEKAQMDFCHQPLRVCSWLKCLVMKQTMQKQSVLGPNKVNFQHLSTVENSGGGNKSLERSQTIVAYVVTRKT